MSTATTTLPFTAETTIGEIAAARPFLSRVFERLGIDFCCGGKQFLSQACTRRGLDISTTRALLEAARGSDRKPDSGA